jgi:RNA polymerase sigma-70 factor (ECF subfamily)
VHSARPRYKPSSDESARLAQAFRAAASSGDAVALGRLLAEDAILYTDGGGKRLAALNPIRGSDKVVRFFTSIARKGEASAWRVRSAQINGAPGFVLAAPDGSLQTLSVDIRDGRIAAIYVVLNPDKLQRVAF